MCRLSCKQRLRNIKKKKSCAVKKQISVDLWCSFNTYGLELFLPWDRNVLRSDKRSPQSSNSYITCRRATSKTSVYDSRQDLFVWLSGWKFFFETMIDSSLSDHAASECSCFSLSAVLSEGIITWQAWRATPARRVSQTQTVFVHIL